MLLPRFSLRAGVILTLCAALAVLSGCGRAARVVPAPAPPPNAPAALTITLALAPQPPQALDPVMLTAHVAGRRGVPALRARVTADLSMPGMEMPANVVTLAPSASGGYVGTARFTMPGAWLVTISAVHGRDSVKRAFPVTVR